MYLLMIVVTANIIIYYMMYKSSFVYCRELAPGTVRLTGYRVRCKDSKHYENVYPMSNFFDSEKRALILTT